MTNFQNIAQHFPSAREMSQGKLSTVAQIYGDSYYGRFGNTVSLSSNGKRLAVSSRTKQTYYDGKIQVFTLNESDEDIPQWDLIGNEIYMDGSVDSSDVHVELDEDGETMITGLSYNDGAIGEYKVQAKVFRLMSGNQWVQLAGEISSSSSIGFPSDVSVTISGSGNRIAVGFSLDEEVLIYDLEQQWKLVGLIVGKSLKEHFGTAISLSADGSTIVIGAPKYSTTTIQYVGCTRVYRFLSNKWKQIGSDIIGESSMDESGTSLDINADGSIIMIGSTCNDSCRGHVRIYQYNSLQNHWNQLGQDIDGESGEIFNERVGDLSGKSVSMSSDGFIIAIGAPNNRKESDSYYTGQVRMYSFQQGQWVQVLDDIDGFTDGDTLGYSLSLSGDGKQLAIGAPGNDYAKNHSGLVRVYHVADLVKDSPEGGGLNSALITGIASTVAIFSVWVFLYICYRQKGSKVHVKTSHRKKSDNHEIKAEKMSTLKSSGDEIWAPHVPPIVRSGDASTISAITMNISSQKHINVSRDDAKLATSPKRRQSDRYLKDLDDDFSDDGRSYDVSYLPCSSTDNVSNRNAYPVRPFSAAESVASIMNYASSLILPLKTKKREIEQAYFSGHAQSVDDTSSNAESFLSLSNFMGLHRMTKPKKPSEREQEYNFILEDAISSSERKSRHQSGLL